MTGFNETHQYNIFHLTLAQEILVSYSGIISAPSNITMHAV